MGAVLSRGRAMERNVIPVTVARASLAIPDARGVDLAGMAKAAGFALTGTVTTQQDLKTWVPKLYTTPGPVLMDLKVNANRYPLSIRLRDGPHIKNRFREALLGAKAFD